MANPNPEHLFQQAERLLVPLAGESEPREADIRRAVSAAYYGVFHFISAAATDLFLGAAARGSQHYNFMYRSVDHGWLRELCEQIRGSATSKKPPHLPGAFFTNVGSVAATAALLQERRHSADYSPDFSTTAADARIIVRLARGAIAVFDAADERERVAFLALLLFNLRRS